MFQARPVSGPPAIPGWRRTRCDEMEPSMTDDTRGRKPRPDDSAPKQPTDGETSSQRKKERARFAKAITRMEFGRYYWDDRMAEELKSTLDRRKKK